MSAGNCPAVTGPLKTMKRGGEADFNVKVTATPETMTITVTMAEPHVGYVITEKLANWYDADQLAASQLVAKLWKTDDPEGIWPGDIASNFYLPPGNLEMDTTTCKLVLTVPLTKFCRAAPTNSRPGTHKDFLCEFVLWKLVASTDRKDGLRIPATLPVKVVLKQALEGSCSPGNCMSVQIVDWFVDSVNYRYDMLPLYGMKSVNITKVLCKTPSKLADCDRIRYNGAQFSLPASSTSMISKETVTFLVSYSPSSSANSIVTVHTQKNCSAQQQATCPTTIEFTADLHKTGILRGIHNFDNFRLISNCMEDRVLHMQPDDLFSFDLIAYSDGNLAVTKLRVIDATGKTTDILANRAQFQLSTASTKVLDDNELFDVNSNDNGLVTGIPMKADQSVTISFSLQVLDDFQLNGVLSVYVEVQRNPYTISYDTSPNNNNRRQQQQQSAPQITGLTLGDLCVGDGCTGVPNLIDMPTSSTPTPSPTPTPDSVVVVTQPSSGTLVTVLTGVVVALALAVGALMAIVRRHRRRRNDNVTVPHETTTPPNNHPFGAFPTKALPADEEQEVDAFDGDAELVDTTTPGDTTGNVWQ